MTFSGIFAIGLSGVNAFSQSLEAVSNNIANAQTTGFKRARKEIENMSGRKVFLRLRVKVRKNWRNDDFFLKSFTFGGEQE